MMNSGSHTQVSRYQRFYFHPEAHVGSGGTPDSQPAPPAPDSATTPESTTGTTTPSGSTTTSTTAAN